jgi:hypothetical protein
MVLNTLNPSAAVVRTMPGIWGCQWSSLTSFWPWWTKRSWGGTSSGLPSGPWASALRSSSSGSTERSQSVTWSSDPDAAKTDGSVGCHSTDVIGAVCQVKWATGLGVLSCQLASPEENVAGKKKSLTP